MDVEINGVNELIAAFDTLPAHAKAAAQKAVTRATTLVFRDSIRNSPRSPTMAQRAAVRKTRQNTSNRKQATATTRAKPGGLERSISMSLSLSEAKGTVYVAANSEAGKYALRIHDEKGKTWRKRGLGTIAKGQHADDKFIERALRDNRDNIELIFKEEMDKVRL